MKRKRLQSSCRNHSAVETSFRETGVSTSLSNHLCIVTRLNSINRNNENVLLPSAKRKRAIKNRWALEERIQYHASSPQAIFHYLPLISSNYNLSFQQSSRVSIIWFAALLLFTYFADCMADDVEPVNWQRIPTPPRFMHEPNPRVIYFSVDYGGLNGNGHNGNHQNYRNVQQAASSRPNIGSPILDTIRFREKTLRCAAVGIPPPVYNWLKDNVSLPLHMFRDRVSQSRRNASLTFTRFVEEDEGDYQCTATNDNGTSVSETITLREAWIRPFPEFEPETVTVELGDPYSRNCTPPESSPDAHVFWLFRSPKDNQFLQAINSSHISSNDKGTIFFHNVQESDYRENRFYACAAYNSKLKEYKFKNVFNFRIKKTKRDRLNTVIPAAEQYVNQSSPVALVGEIHKLHCFFSGYPDPYPTWYHNGLEIIQNNTKGFTFENYGKTLVFNVTMDHMGRYECKFQTHASAVDRVFNVKVDAAPYWHDMPPANTNTSEGETVVFDCKTSGNPTPIVTFYKNGVEMRRPRQGENWVIDGSRLTIYDVKKGTNGDGDNAVYQCKSENKHGYLWTNFYLNLLAFEPKLLEEPDIAEAIEGKPFTTSCKFFASPLANVTWKSPLLSGVAYRSSVDQFGAGWLIFEEVKESLEGEYNCVGTNKYGSAQGTVKLLVRKPTALAQFQSETMEWQAGVPLKLSCEAEHDPNLVISYEWKVNKKSIEDSGAVTSSYESEPVTMGGFGEAQHYRILKDNTLLIQNPTQHDSGSYVCTASTKLDSVSKKVFISVEDVPVPVFSAFILRCDTQANSATIQFEHLEPAIGTVPVKEFWVRYISDPEEESGKWRMHPASIRAIDYEVVNDAERRVKASITIPLRPFGSYLFQIVARNAIGDSAPQNVKGNCVTEQKPPTRNPSGVRVEGTQPDNLIVHWEAMPRDEWNGEKFAYQVLFRPVVFKGMPFGTKHVDEFVYGISDLTKFKGCVDETPQEMISRVINYYECHLKRCIEMKDEPGAEWQRVDVNDPFVERLAIDLGERRAWMPYEVQIRARNQLGDSLVTPEIVDGRTGEGDPGVTPSNFRVTDITATSAQFHWDAVDPSRVQGNFTGYKITYWYDEDEEIVDNADNGYTDGGPSTAAVQHVVMEAKRRRLRRQHHANARDASSSIVRRQRSTVSGGTTASGGGYDISSSSPALYRKTIVVAPDVTSAVVHSLRPNALNYATVTVMNGQNDGAKSDVVSFRTREGVPSPVRRLSAYPLNNRDATERGLVVLRWEPPRVANGQLTHFGVRKCHTRDVAREVLECDESRADRRLPLNITELRWDGLDYDATYRFQVYAYTNAGAGVPNSADARTLPEAMRLDVDPVRPSLVVDAIGEDHINVTFVPGHYDADKQAPVGNSFYVKYRETDGEPPATGTASSHTTVANNESTGDGDWKFQHADGDSLGMRVGGLTPGTRYQLAVIAMNRDNIGRVRESESRIHEVTTGGVSPRRAILYWILAAIALLLLLLLLLCLCCACARQRGEKYPVAEKERLHGRDTSHPKDRAFDEYGRPDDDEKRSLTGHSRAGESETDSMAEFGEGDPGRFTEDGSFIGQYGPNKTLVVTTTVPAPEAATATSGHHHYHHQSSQQSQQYWPSK